jgi:autotransporter passenger strand-loop-strand repeat protein
MGILITSFGQIGATADLRIHVDFTLEIATHPFPVLTTRESLGFPSTSGGPIVLLGGGSLIPASGGGLPPIIVAPPRVFDPWPILLDPSLFWVAVDGAAQEGRTLMATTNIEGASYQWQELVGGAWVNLQGATASTYLVQHEDVGRQIRIQIAGTGSRIAISGPTNAVLDTAGDQYVYETDTGTTIKSGLFQYVHGTAIAAAIEAGGEQNIYAGGLAVATTLNTGGIQVDWGDSTGAAINGGTQYVWGTASSTSIGNGQQIVMSGGSATDTEIYPTGEQIVLTGASASSTMVVGTQSVYGTADITTIRFGGLQQVHGLATNTTVNLYGHQNVYADGTAIGTTLTVGSVQIDWGTATNTTVDMNSAQYVWGVATDTTLTQRSFLGLGGTQYVGAGGSTYGTDVGANCTQYVYGGGTSAGTFVEFLGSQVVYGTTTDTTVYGHQDVWGIATNTTINSNAGVQDVHAGGLAQNTTIDDLASAHVFAGGTIGDVTFSGRFAGLVLDQGSTLAGSISGWHSFDTIDLAGVSFVDGTTTLAYAAYGDNSGGSLTVSDGTHAMTLSLLGQYTASDFAINSDGHGGTSVFNPIFLTEITITPPPAA